MAVREAQNNSGFQILPDLQLRIHQLMNSNTNKEIKRFAVFMIWAQYTTWARGPWYLAKVPYDKSSPVYKYHIQTTAVKKHQNAQQ